MNDVMCDLETLGTDNDAVILSIALVRFDIDDTDSYDTLQNDPADYLVLYPNVEWQIQQNRSITFSTLAWWMEQNNFAQAVFKKERKDASEVAQKIVEWVGGNDYRLWGNGSNFDNVILHSFFRSTGVKNPFRFWNARDLRTLKDIAGYGRGRPNIVRGVEHDALDDAMYQILCAQHYMRVIMGKEVNDT